jgi:hypothetical protein
MTAISKYPPATTRQQTSFADMKSQKRNKFQFTNEIVFTSSRS